MSKKLASFEKKAREAKNANVLVEAISGYAAEGGTSAVIQEVIGSASVKMHPAHLISLAYIDSHVNKGISAIGQKLIDRALSEADFSQKISIAAIVSEFGNKAEGIKISEAAFESIEGDGDYLFHALQGVCNAVMNSVVDGIGGDGYAPISVGDHAYKVSTIMSVYEDMVAMRDSISDDDFIGNCMDFAKCLYRIDELEKGNQIINAALTAAKTTDDLISLINCVGEIEKLGPTPFDPLESIAFPEESVKERLRKEAGSRLKGEELADALDCLSS